MQRPPTVTVAICLLNSSHFIDETLESVFAQTFDDYEVILVDDGSTDGCADRVERLYRDRRLRVIRQQHQGLSIARRVSISSAAGRYVAFLDHDDLWLPEKLGRQATAAAADPTVALLFSDCLYIDALGRPLGRLSDQYRLSSLDLTRGYAELLVRGCFVWQSTVFAKTAVLRSVASFNPIYPYIADYDTWLRVARRHRMHYTPEVLAKWRMHANQFTNRCPEITLADHKKLLGPLSRTASIPRTIRIALGDRLLGQHRVSCLALLKQRRLRLAAAAALGMFGYPDRLLAFCISKVADAPLLGRLILGSYRSARRLINELRRPKRPGAAQPPSKTHVWIDGSVLGTTQTGSFGLISELIRALQARDSCVVHVVSTKPGRLALANRLGSGASQLRFHKLGWRALRWTDVDRLLTMRSTHLLLLCLWVMLLTSGELRGNQVLLMSGSVMALGQFTLLADEWIAAIRELMGKTSARFAVRAVQRLVGVLSRPRGRPPEPGTLEVIIWRGRFRWAESHRVAIVQDLTPRIHPEMHPADSVLEFEEFLGYVQRHADSVATVSEHSKKDILDQLGVFPESVSVIPMPIHPCYAQPRFERGFLTLHGITQPYVVHVGCIEPRKNLRRLLKAFELLKAENSVRDHILVLAGPQGWDEDFPRALRESEVYARVRTLGFVPTEHLPSFYHFASAVVYPSLYEGFGLPVFEAMCASSIVLASGVSSLPEVLGEAGVLFDPYSVEEMAAAILRALTMTPAESADYRRRARSRGEGLLAKAARLPPLPALPVRASLAVA